MKPYFQTTSFTCAASSLLTIIHHLNNEIPLNKEKEFEIWRKTTNLPTRSSSIYALANYAKKQGLNPKVIVAKKEYSFPDYRFYRYTKEDVKHASYNEQVYLEKAQAQQVEIVEKETELTDIKKYLEKNKIILLRLNTKPIRNEKKNTSNYLVVHGYNEGYYQIIDPALGAFSIPEQIMQESFESLESKKYRDHRAIIF